MRTAAGSSQRPSRLVLAATAVPLALMAAACGSTKHAAARPASASAPQTSAPQASAPQAAATITIKSFTFNPSPLRVKAGTTITVANDDGTDHTITADDKSFDTGRFSGGTRTVQAGAVGTHPFHCDVHDFMRGVIEVTG